MQAKKRVGKRLDATTHTRKDKLQNCLDRDIEEAGSLPREF
jgi:hypothetical protein